jgi:type I site-specific restriction endonuclease
MTIELAGSAPKPPSLASPLAKMREAATRDLDARQSAPSAARKADALSGEAAAVRDSAEQTEKAQRQTAKDQARQRIQMLMEKLQALKKMGSDSPEVMAKMLAQIVKELKKAIDSYVAAGGSAGGWATSLAAPQGDAPSGDGKAADVYTAMRDSLAGSEAAGDMDFVKAAKGIAQTIRDLLDKAKVRVAKPPDEATQKAFEEGDDTLTEVDKALDGLDRAIKASSPAAGLFIALYA